MRDLEYEVDATQVVNAAYVKGANANGSGWVRDAASIAAYGERQDSIDVPDSDTASKGNRYGRNYLADKKDPLERGSFKV